MESRLCALALPIGVMVLAVAGCGGSSSPSSSNSTYTVGGTVSGLDANESVTLLNNGGDAKSYLRRFPIDKLKIDRCFIEHMTRPPEDASVVSSIISLVHSLRLKVIAEGVESPEQLQRLAELGCDQYQGFLFSPALESGQFVALMKQEPRLTDDEAARTHSK